jgi:hypothetical protein
MKILQIKKLPILATILLQLEGSATKVTRYLALHLYLEVNLLMSFWDVRLQVRQIKSGFSCFELPYLPFHNGFYK